MRLAEGFAWLKSWMKVWKDRTIDGVMVAHVDVCVFFDGKHVCVS